MIRHCRVIFIVLFSSDLSRECGGINVFAFRRTDKQTASRVSGRHRPGHVVVVRWKSDDIKNENLNLRRRQLPFLFFSVCLANPVPQPYFPTPPPRFPPDQLTNHVSRTRLQRGLQHYRELSPPIPTHFDAGSTTLSSRLFSTIDPEARAHPKGHKRAIAGR